MTSRQESPKIHPGGLDYWIWPGPGGLVG